MPRASTLRLGTGMKCTSRCCVDGLSSGDMFILRLAECFWHPESFPVPRVTLATLKLLPAQELSPMRAEFVDMLHPLQNNSCLASGCRIVLWTPPIQHLREKHWQIVAESRDGDRQGFQDNKHLIAKQTADLQVFSLGVYPEEVDGLFWECQHRGHLCWEGPLLTGRWLCRLATGIANSSRVSLPFLPGDELQ
jgi:hypothetical protein